MCSPSELLHGLLGGGGGAATGAGATGDTALATVSAIVSWEQGGVITTVNCAPIVLGLAGQLGHIV